MLFKIVIQGVIQFEFVRFLNLLPFGKLWEILSILLRTWIFPGLKFAFRKLFYFFTPNSKKENYFSYILGFLRSLLLMNFGPLNS